MGKSSIVLLQEMIEDAFFNLLDIEGIEELTETKELLNKMLNMVDDIANDIQDISWDIEDETDDIDYIKAKVKEDVEKIIGKEADCSE